MKELIPERRIRSYCKRIAKTISEEYKNSFSEKPLVLLGVMNGAMPFLVDVARQIDEDIPVIIDTVKCSTYSGVFTKGKTKITKMPDNSLNGKLVILVDDIVDTGQTITTLINRLSKKNKSADFKICSLLKRRGCELNVDYLGKVIDKDLWVVGYGLDDDGLKRNLKSIFVKNV